MKFDQITMRTVPGGLVNGGAQNQPEDRRGPFDSTAETGMTQ